MRNNGTQVCFCCLFKKRKRKPTKPQKSCHQHASHLCNLGALALAHTILEYFFLSFLLLRYLKKRRRNSFLIYLPYCVLTFKLKLLQGENNAQISLYLSIESFGSILINTVDGRCQWACMTLFYEILCQQ